MGERSRKTESEKEREKERDREKKRQKTRELNAKKGKQERGYIKK